MVRGGWGGTKPGLTTLQLTGPRATQPKLGNVGLPEVDVPEDAQPPTLHHFPHLTASPPPKPRPLQVHLFSTQSQPPPPTTPSQCAQLHDMDLPEDDFPEDDPTFNSTFQEARVGVGALSQV